MFDPFFVMQSSRDIVALHDRERAKTRLCIRHEFYIVVRKLLIRSDNVLSPAKTYRIQEEPVYAEVSDIFPCGKGSAGKYSIELKSCFTK